MGAPSVGVFSVLRLGVAGGSINEAYEFISESMTENIEYVGGNGISGSRDTRHERIALGRRDVSGSITFEPTPEELDLLAPRILGGTKDVTLFTIAIANTLPAMDIQFDKVGDVIQYNGCKVNRATIRANVGEVVQLVLELIGKTQTLPSAASAAITHGAPYVFHEGVFKFDTVTREVNSVEVSIENNLLADINRFSATRTHVPEGRVRVTCSPVMPFSSDEVAVLAKEVVGAAAQLKFTKAGKSFTIDLANLKFSGPGPQVGSKDGEILYQPTGVAYATSANGSILFTSDIVA